MRTARFATWHHLFLALLLGAGVPAAAQAQVAEKLPPTLKLAAIEPMPTAIALKHPFDYAQVLLTGVLETGERIDVTRMAEVEVPMQLVSATPRGLVRPVADGSGALRFTVEGKSVAVPVTVSGQKEKYAASFVRDVMPTLSRMGCNAGTCHGSAKGKNGFQLSLRGYDPMFDHRSLTDDVMARRINRAAPDRSLMLLKPTGEVPHVGGVLTKPGEPYYELLRSWIAEGVKLDLNGPRVSKIEVFPKNPVLPLFGMKQQMVVLATCSDGAVRDVSAEAFLESSNSEVAAVDRQGLVTAVRRGETAMLARYEGSYAAAPLIVMGDRSAFAWQPVPEYNYIDTLVYDKLKQVKVQPSDVCTDNEFIRRVYIDLIGLPPQPAEVRAFLADTKPSKEKREALVDRLIGSPEFIEHWTNKWADLLQVNSKFLGVQGAQAFRDYIRKSVAANKPYDQFVHEVLTASGSNLDNPAASYWKVLRQPGATMENTTHLFLAVRFNCNKCHDHPFERWTQDQYYHLAAFFAQVERKEDPRFRGQKIGGSNVEQPQPLVEIIGDMNQGDVKHDRTGAVSAPQFPFTHGDLAPPTASRREQLARWIASKENPYFARSYVNRVWSYLLGVGIIEPVDDIRAGNPPTNPRLLERLTGEFIASGFNVQELMRVICKSRTYQHSIVTNNWNADDDINYSHALARRLPAEVLYDAIHRATGSVSRLPGLPAGSRAALLVDSSAPIPGGFLELLGRPPRESACECERSNSMLLGSVLNLVNGPILNNAVRDPDNNINRLVAQEKDDAKVVEEMFLAILCRPPTRAELDVGIKALRGTSDEHPVMMAEHAKLVAALEAYEKQLNAKQPEWEANLKRTPVWTVLEPDDLKSEGGTTLTKQLDGSVLASGKNPHPETYRVTGKTSLAGITAIRLEVLHDAGLPANGPGRSQNGNFVLNEFKVEAAQQGEDKAKPVTLQNAIADFSQATFEVKKAIDNKPGTGWAVSPQLGKDHVAVFELKDKLGTVGSTTLTFTLLQKFTSKDHNIGKFRLSVTTVPPPVQLQGLPDDVARALHVESDKRTPQQQAVLTNLYRSKDAELPRLQRAVAEHVVPSDSRAMGAQDLAWALLNDRSFLFNH